ncbi:Nitrogen fixation nifHD region GlnB-like protein 2 [Desulfosarcina cetonica]|uniref:P-II family nitrogen regulator n=1 Tax=Desulfosarcina cetonica TaxID=90730 RepID=UPI0006D27B64|nr:P-II family nitrogen regulator [Desulfosarcina cetonica]VTR67908.1 Nitrogen fixation nifHD region GlnB-like protein 2 [Desulfosarcina cetonica]
MKEIMAIVRMNMINQTRKALTEMGISSMTATDALGRGAGLVDMTLLKGAEQGYEEAISQLGQSNRLIPKRVLVIVSKEKYVDKIVKTIIKVNKTGKPGDGKIFVMPVADSISVRTAENGDSSLDDL